LTGFTPRKRGGTQSSVVATVKRARQLSRDFHVFWSWRWRNIMGLPRRLAVISRNVAYIHRETARKSWPFARIHPIFDGMRAAPMHRRLS
jgi:hypothetical protein